MSYEAKVKALGQLLGHYAMRALRVLLQESGLVGFRELPRG